jgi:flagellar biosynthesis/type III secretory pathway chaperone
MEKNVNRLKDLYTERISLYEDLLSCIKRESDNLISQNIKGIWASLDEKKEIMEAIEENNRHLPENTRLNPVLTDVPRQDRDAIIHLKIKLKNLKMEIGIRIKENVSFINETLGFINDIFSVFRGADKKPDIYDRNLKKRNGSSNLIYHNEV